MTGVDAHTLKGRLCAGFSSFQPRPSALDSPRRLLHIDGDFDDVGEG